MNHSIWNERAPGMGKSLLPRSSRSSRRSDATLKQASRTRKGAVGSASRDSRSQWFFAKSQTKSSCTLYAPTKDNQAIGTLACVTPNQRSSGALLRFAISRMSGNRVQVCLGCQA